MLNSLVKLENINLDIKSKDKDSLLNEMISILDKNGYISDFENFKNDIYKREALNNTGIGFNVAIPHTKSKFVKECCICVGVSKDGIDYKSIDGKKVNLIFMIAVKDSESDLHLQALSKLSRKLIYEDFRNKLLNATTKEQFFEILCNE